MKGRSGHVPMLPKASPETSDPAPDRRIYGPPSQAVRSGGSPLSVHQHSQVRPFEISEVDLDPECREVRVAGELDLSVAGRLRERLDAAVLADVEILVCLEQCDFIDSTGIAAILFAHKQAASRGRGLSICNPSGQVGRILAMTGLNDIGLVYASTEAALAERVGCVAGQT